MMHPAVDTMLRRMHPSAAAWLPRLLEPLAMSERPDAAWGSSRLTPSRLPVEASVALGSSASRYTCEVCPPEMEPSERLAFAIGRLRTLGLMGGGSLITDVAAQWHRASNTLRWGAWVSGRHDDDGDRFKLYLEVPVEARAAAVGAAYRYHGVDGLPGAPVMVGLDLVGGRCE